MTNEKWLKWAISRYYRSHGYKVSRESKNHECNLRKLAQDPPPQHRSLPERISIIGEKGADDGNHVFLCGPSQLETIHPVQERVRESILVVWIVAAGGFRLLI